MDNSIGYQEDPRDENGIIRSRTRRQIRAWDIPRSLSTLEILKIECGTDFPGIYILFDGDKKVYIGEAKSIYKRLKQHSKNPENKIKNWNRAIIINDGRQAVLSDFNDSVIRRALEYFLIDLFKLNKYNVVSQGEPQTPNTTQAYFINSLNKELIYFLKKKNVINKAPVVGEPREVFSDELQQILKNKGKTIEDWSKFQAKIDNETYFIRTGSKKARGYQITFRGRKSGSFIDMLNKGVGYLLFSRNGVLTIPLTEIKKIIDPKILENQDTVDIWIDFDEDKISLKYKDKSIDVSNFKLINS